MTGRGAAGATVFFLIISIILTILVIPGVGFETRPSADFPSWQTSLFMIGGPILILVSLLGAATALRWNRVGGSLAVLSGLISLCLSSVGLAMLGATAIPSGVRWVDIAHLVVSLLLLPLGAVTARRRPPIPAPPSPPA